MLIGRAGMIARHPNESDNSYSANEVSICENLFLQYYAVSNIHTQDFKCSFKIKLETEDETN